MLSLATLNCGSLFGNNEPTTPATAAFLDPTLSFSAGFDCTAGGQNPVTVTWSVAPVTLTPGSTTGLSAGFSVTENLTNIGGDTADCYFQPSTTVSQASGAAGLQPGLWQITVNHSLVGYTNPLVCPRQLALGPNNVTFVFGPQGAACQ
jgi:hypothetical protein